MTITKGQADQWDVEVKDAYQRGYEAGKSAVSEPVAYLVYAKGSRRYFTLTFDTAKVPEIYVGGEVVPLYTTPPAEAKRKPLTKEQIITAMCGDGCERIESFYHVGPVQKAAVWSFAQAIHNIGAKEC